MQNKRQDRDEVFSVIVPKGDYGSLRQDAIDELEQDLNLWALSTRARHLIIDLSGVAALGAALLNLLVRISTAMRHRSRQLILCGDAEGVLSVAGLPRVIPHFASQYGAVRYALDHSRLSSFALSNCLDPCITSAISLSLDRILSAHVHHRTRLCEVTSGTASFVSQWLRTAGFSDRNLSICESSDFERTLALPFKSGSVDMLVLPLWQARDSLPFSSEVHRVLGVGGSIVSVVPSDVYCGRSRLFEPDSHLPANDSELRKCLWRTCGLRIVQVTHIYLADLPVSCRSARISVYLEGGDPVVSACLGVKTKTRTSMRDNLAGRSRECSRQLVP